MELLVCELLRHGADGALDGNDQFCSMCVIFLLHMSLYWRADGKAGVNGGHSRRHVTQSLLPGYIGLIAGGRQRSTLQEVCEMPFAYLYVGDLIA